MLDAARRAFVAASEKQDLYLLPEMANRHGLIAGATGTGKTVTLQTMAETFSSLGVPVFMTDIKGDLSGVCKAGAPKGKIAERIELLGLREKGYANRGFPVCFWDVFGEKGHPVRATVSQLGPLLLSRLMNLSEVQSGVLSAIFHIADDKGLLLLDLKDLRAMAQHAGEARMEYKLRYGNISPASVGAIQRSLLQLEEQGADLFFGEPALDMGDLMQTDADGRGVISILAADKLMNSPRMYATVLLWLLSELFEQLPERGDAPLPRLVLFFDEAHLLFSNAPDVLLEKIEQVVRLIRSRGVGVYFVTQNPVDIPDAVAAQLGNRVQHALRAFTPKEQKAVRAAAQSFRANPAFNTEDVIGQLAVGEALISFLDGKGVPAPVERAFVLPPEGQVGPVDDAERQAVMQDSLVAGAYDEAVDRESAYELLTARAMQDQQKQDEARQVKEALRRAQEEEKAARMKEREEARARREAEKARKNSAAGMLDDALKQTGRSLTRTIGREVGKSILRGILGGLFGGKR
ncbi:MAG: DUF853 family protein [Desulfovibrionaceae bacterium]|nr:DUF853 family protein [Desulfovibrionaceae bacterium]MBR5734714.1 DUF853 family protein [Desulfovibrionaceae bacterium]